VSRGAVAQQEARRAPAPRGGILQRKCACGQHTGEGAQCEECKKREEHEEKDRARARRHQSKLAVGSAGDPCEREADRIADLAGLRDPDDPSYPQKLNWVKRPIESR
jgi:hypothetical protein